MSPHDTIAAMQTRIVCVVGPTASGKSARAVAEALARDGEVISVDSRQVYRTLDIGTEKTKPEDMQGVPHHLIDIRDPNESYSAGDFVLDSERLITDLTARGKLPIFAGGSHFYFDALLYGLPGSVPVKPELRALLEAKTTEALYDELVKVDPRRARMLDPLNRPRLVRALEVVASLGTVPARQKNSPRYDVEWIVLNPARDVLRERIDARLQEALTGGLIEEVARIRGAVGDTKLDTFGLEYRVVGEFLRGERSHASLFPRLSAKLWQYARRQKAWLRKLESEYSATEAASLPGKS